jgi:GNAT superfamily N-acetyltransferase
VDEGYKPNDQDKSALSDSGDSSEVGKGEHGEEGADKRRPAIPEEERQAKLARILEENGYDGVPHTSEVYAKYGYSPEQPTEQETAPSIEINWEELNARVIAASTEVLSAESDVENRVVVDVGNGVSLEVAKRPHYFSEQYDTSWPAFTMKLQQTQENDDGEESTTTIADFHCYQNQDGHEWYMGHRLVDPRYRSQGVGTKMIGLIEVSVQEYANHTGEPQTITIDAGQVGVISFGIRNGFLPRSETDMGRVERILSGNKGLIVQTGVVFGEDGGWAPGMVFEREDIETAYKWIHDEDPPEGIKWTQNNVNAAFSWDPAEVIGRSLRLDLSKELKPTS